MLREGCDADPRRLLLLVASLGVQLDAAGKTGIGEAGQLVAPSEIFCGRQAAYPCSQVKVARSVVKELGRSLRPLQP